MAELVDVTSAAIVIIGATAKSSKILYDLLKSLKIHQSVVDQMVRELEDLGKVLASLNDHVGIDDATLQPLKRPLLQCLEACRDFKEFIEKNNRHSTNLQNWASLRWRSSSITDFTNILANYKSTLTIALEDANLYDTCPMEKRLPNIFLDVFPE